MNKEFKTMEKDRLSEMLEIQKKFTAKVIRHLFNKDIEDLDKNELKAYLKDLFIHITVECTEVLQEFSWKMHRKDENKEIDRDRIIEELVDIDKFHKNFLIVLGVSEDEYYKKWIEKSKFVEARFNEENKVYE